MDPEGDRSGGGDEGSGSNRLEEKGDLDPMALNSRVYSDPNVEISSIQRKEGDFDHGGATASESGGAGDDGSSAGIFARGESSGTSPVDVIGTGRAAVLKGVIHDADSKFEAALASQDSLALSIDRLTRVLDKLLEDTPMPFLAQDSARVHGLRKRVLSLSSTLQIIRVRMKNIESALLHQSKDE
ncbi:hypothetical protein SELMODRAFT_403072 [Selaginella moellendorffii]|uniref:Biogenesis of lysosome-related organelles complex 1 subunit 7 n=1 Tax=Selaginella moellendorffii TaxID=88036 RepID=D8QNY8_SELML|nr:hypothetical protein SELMODRAFT_403072 [Selaginella moellendorffii]